MATKLLKCEHPDYPAMLPFVRPEWLTDTVLNLAKLVHETGDYSTLPILADALQDAGCDDEDTLNHLRHGIHEQGNRDKWEGGCWCGTCWIVRHLLKEPQRVMALYRMPGMMIDDLDECPVLNPGDAVGIDGGTAWLVETTTTYIADRVRAIVEASNMSRADTEFVSSAFGEDIRITEPDLSDYKAEPSDVFPNEWSCNWTHDGQHAYDSDELDEFDMHPDQPGSPLLTYHGPGIPHDGVTPGDYKWGDWTCLMCERPIGYIRRSAKCVCDSPKCIKELQEIDDDVA